MWASTEHGTPATSVELIERLRSGSTWSERMLSRDGNIHNLDAHIDELLIASRRLFERPVEPRAVLASIQAALSHTSGVVDLRVDLYGGPGVHVLALATQREEDGAEPTAVRLRIRPSEAALQPWSVQPQDTFSVGMMSGVIHHPAAGSLCLVSAHRFVWPDSQRPLDVTGRVIADQFVTTGA